MKHGTLSEFENSRKDDIRKGAQAQIEVAKRDRLEKKEFQAELDSRVKILVGSIEVPQVEALDNLYAVAANYPDAKLRKIMIQQALAAKHKFDSDQMRMYREMVAMDKLLFELKESEEAAHTKMEADLAAARSRLEESKLKIDEEEEQRYKTEERLQREGKMEIQKDMNKVLETRRKDFLAKKARFNVMESALVEEELTIRAICAKIERKRQYGEQMVKLCHDQWEIEESGRRPEDRVGYIRPNRLTWAQTYMALEDGCQALAKRYCSTGVTILSQCFRVTSRNLKWCFCGGENEDLFSHPDALKAKDPPASPLVAKMSIVLLGSEYRLVFSQSRSASFRARIASLNAETATANAMHTSVVPVTATAVRTRQPGHKSAAATSSAIPESRPSLNSNVSREATRKSRTAAPPDIIASASTPFMEDRSPRANKGSHQGEKGASGERDQRPMSDVLGPPVLSTSVGGAPPKKKKLNLFDQATFEEVSKAKVIEEV